MRQPFAFHTCYVVDETSGCWLWQRPLNGSGYGGVFHDGQRMGAHRASYLIHVGPIPPGHQIDHLCRVRACVNPAHLEAVTRSENMRRGDSGLNVRQRQQAKDACPQGHPYDDTNTVYDRRGWRSCRICRRAAYRRYRMRKKASA